MAGRAARSHARKVLENLLLGLFPGNRTGESIHGLLIRQSIDLIGARCPCPRLLREPAFEYRQAHPKFRRL
jgi:hypothetical protein